jgi:MFS family permease
LNILPSYTDYFQLTTVTTALNTSVVNVGSALAGFVNGLLCDRLGRRMALYWAALITIVGIILQSAAQNIGMFIVGRLVIGFGVGISSAAAPTYLAEAVPYKWRALTLGLFYVFWYVGEYDSSLDYFSLVFLLFMEKMNDQEPCWPPESHTALPKSTRPGRGEPPPFYRASSA